MIRWVDQKMSWIWWSNDVKVPVAATIFKLLKSMHDDGMEGKG